MNEQHTLFRPVLRRLYRGQENYGVVRAFRLEIFTRTVVVCCLLYVTPPENVFSTWTF